MVSSSWGERESGSHTHPHPILQRLRLHRGPRADGLPSTVVHPLNLLGVGRGVLLVVNAFEFEGRERELGMSMGVRVT